MLQKRMKRTVSVLLAMVLLLFLVGCSATNSASGGLFTPGTYTGTGTGRNGSVALTLTLTNGAIASVDNVTHSETARYWEKAKVLLDRLVGLQTPEQVEKLDAVTGATQAELTADADEACSAARCDIEHVAYAQGRHQQSLFRQHHPAVVELIAALE